MGLVWKSKRSVLAKGCKVFINEFLKLKWAKGMLCGIIQIISIVRINSFGVGVNMVAIRVYLKNFQSSNFNILFYPTYFSEQ